MAGHVSVLVLAQVPALLLADPETASSDAVSTRRRACSEMTVATQTEGLPRTVAVRVSGCRECQSLLLPGEDGRDATCARCEQVDELLSLVVKLREKLERLKTIRVQAEDWWSDSLQERQRLHPPNCSGPIPFL